MAAQISINQLPPAGAITGAELVPVVQNGQTVQTTTGAISGSPSQTQSFLTVNQEPTLVNSRYLAVSTGLGLTNGGAGSFLRISLNGASGSLEAAGNGLVVKDSSSSVVARQIAVNGAGLSITDPSGVAGNPTLALSGLAAAFANLGGSGLAYVNAGTTAGLRLLTGTSNQITVTDGNGVAGNPTFALASNPVIPGTGAMTIPIGTSAQQPGGSDGQFRFNSDTGTFDGYAAGSWRTFSLSGGVTTFSAGSTGLTPAVPTSGSVTLAGTLNTSNGGTGLGGASPFTQYGILYASSANALTTGTALTFDGTNLGVGNNAFAWDTAAFNNAIDLSVYGAIYSTSSVAGVTGNVYYDGSAWHIKTLGPSTRYDQTAGSHVFYAAPTPVGLGNTTPTFVEILRLNTTGITLDGGTANGVLYLNGSKVATSGSALTFDGTNLGIGTSSPGARLDVVATASRAGLFRTNQAFSGIEFNDSGTSANPGVYSNGNSLTVWTGGAQRITLDSSGNLGVGVTPSAWSQGRAIELLAPGMGLFNAGSLGGPSLIYLTSNAYVNSGFKYGVNGEASSYLQWLGAHIWSTAPSGTAGNTITFSQVMTLDASGNLGIGTSSPAQKLHVRQDQAAYTWGRVDNQSSSASAYSGWMLGAFGNSWGIAIGSSAANSNALTFVLDAGGTNAEKMRLDSSGNLGLGVTPSAWNITALQVKNGSMYGAGSTEAGWYSNAYYNSGWKYIASGVAAGYVQNGNHQWFTAPSGTAGNAITFTQAMTLDASGNLGIGTSSPGAKLNIVGTTAGIGYLAGIVLSDNATTTVSLGLQTPGGSDFPFVYGNSGLGFGTNSTERMRLDSSGNLGLGVTPSAWGTAVVKSIQVGNGAGFGGNTTSGTPDAYMTSNCYYDGSNWRYITTDAAMTFDLRTNTASNVAAVWNIAPGGTAGDAITFTQAMTLDASGNLGLGVTPSAWNASFKAYQVGNQSLWSVGAGNGYLTNNAFFNTSNAYVYRHDGFATEYIQSIVNGSHSWHIAPSGTAGAAISFTQAMTLDASGNLGLGTTSPVGLGSGFATLDVAGANGGGMRFRTSGNSAYLLANTSSVDIATLDALPMRFITSSTERARITSGGDLLVGTTSSAGKLTVEQGAALRGVIVNADSNGTSDRFFSGYSGSASADTFRVYTNGNVVNTNSSYGSISDAKMKTDIVDAGSQWADIKAIRFRKFKMKNDPSELLQLGVVAQELEQTSPGLVDEHVDRDAEGNDLGTTTKSVKTSILLMKAAKALQEAMARIETLEAKVSALEGN